MQEAIFIFWVTITCMIPGAISTLPAYSKLCAVCPTGCCHNVQPPITWKRRQLINRFLQDHSTQLMAWLDTTTRAYAFPREMADRACIFLDTETRICRIHPVKPETCQAGPITFDLDLSQGRICWYMKSSTDCSIAAALRQTPRELSRYLAMAKPVLRQLIHDLDPTALQAVLQVPEPCVQPLDKEPLPDTLFARWTNVDDSN